MTNVEERPVQRSAFDVLHYGGVALAVLFLALHLPYLPASLEDLDSINFALGVRHFDVAAHQPHPPGYPVYILVTKAAHVLIPSEATALAAVSLGAGALGVLAIVALFRRLEPGGAPHLWPLAAASVAIAAPLYWFTTVRPLSDVPGLVAAITVQALILAANARRAWYAASFFAAFAVGLRSQVFWLTVPLLIFAGWKACATQDARGASVRSGDATHTSCGPEGPATTERYSTRPSAIGLLLSFVAGGLAWGIPLIVVSGGPAAYWRATFNQGAEDLSGVRMLWTTPTPREFADALYYAFVAPWAGWPLATAVLFLAAVGLMSMYRRARAPLVTLAVAFGPYFLFDFVFQETLTSRYALPNVVAIAFLTIAGARRLPRQSGVLVAVGLAMLGAHLGGTTVAAYARTRAPVFRMLDDMRQLPASPDGPPVLATDRRANLDLRRPIVWTGEGMPRFARQLPAPPQHEWLELVNYWNSGGRAPVWFVADPLRTDIDLVQHADPIDYRWALPYSILLGFVRPNDMRWYRIGRPDWYVGEGWALTPEAAGVAELGRRGLSMGSIQGWVRRDVLGGGALVIGGRNFDSTVRPRVTIALGQAWTKELTVQPGAFLEVDELPVIVAAVPEYVPVTIAAEPRSRVAIEQFDAASRASGRPIFGFGDGWHEQEYNPQNGLRWRWLSEHGQLRVASHAPGLVLHLEGESPRRYFSRGSRLVIRSRDQIVFDRVLTDNFSLDVPMASAPDTIILETDQTYTPAERSRRTRDRRHLGLRIFKCDLRPAS
jgi:hypothetical protein